MFTVYPKIFEDKIFCSFAKFCSNTNFFAYKMFIRNVRKLALYENFHYSWNGTNLECSGNVYCIA